MSSEKPSGKVDVKQLSDDDLQELLRLVTDEVLAREDTRRREVSERIMRLAQENRIDLASLVPAGRGHKKLTYRDPANQFNTWAGRGRMPNWLKEYVDQGRKPEEFLVDDRVRKSRTTKK